MRYYSTIEIPGKKEGFAIGDVMAFNLNDGEEFEAMAMKQEDDGMIFCAVDCLAEEYPMMRESGKQRDYNTSDLREILNTTILRQFPEDVVKKMIPFSNGDLLRIPTEKEIFGTNEYGEIEPETVTQWKPMALRRNRIAFQGHNGAWEWYWLQNRVRGVASATTFAHVYTTGNANYHNASNSLGVRPAFKIKNL